MLEAKIKLWDENKVPLGELTVPSDSEGFTTTEAFVAMCWEAADKMAFTLTPSDNWGMEMTITCDFIGEDEHEDA
jgi:hypothetical protein